MSAEAWISLGQFAVVAALLLISAGRWSRDRERPGNGHGRPRKDDHADRELEALRDSCAREHELIWGAIKRNEDHLTAVTKRMNRIEAQET